MADFNATRVLKAAVPHACEECGRTIMVGEQYERVAAVYEGNFFTNAACLHCAAARRIASSVDDWYREDFYNGLDSWFGNSKYEYPIESGVLRIAAGFRERWRYQSGALMPIPEESREQ